MKSVSVRREKLENLKGSKLTLPVSVGNYVQIKGDKSRRFRNESTGEIVSRRTIENYERGGISREKREKREFLKYGGIYDVEKFPLARSSHYTYEYDLGEGVESGKLYKFMQLVMRNYNLKSKRFTYGFAYVFEVLDSFGDRVIQTKNMRYDFKESSFRKEMDRVLQKKGGSGFNLMDVKRVWLKIIERARKGV